MLPYTYFLVAVYASHILLLCMKLRSDVSEEDSFKQKKKRAGGIKLRRCVMNVVPHSRGPGLG